MRENRRVPVGPPGGLGGGNMSANTTIDHRALAWVKKELDETLLHARQSLETYVEAPSDPAPLQSCADLLHQVVGALHIMEFGGAALLAEEMERLARGLLEGSVRQRDDAYEVLMRAILQLPDYLEKLQSGQKDQPIVLLPLLNEIRAALGEKLFSELLLFAPDLSAVDTDGRLQSRALSGADTDIRQEARKLRHRYQLGLLGWYRGQDPAANLKALADVIAQLEAISSQQPVMRLWWIAGALIEALAGGGLDATVSVKQLLGQLDRQIKRVIDEGEEGLVADLPTALIKNLLYYIAQAQPCGERVRDVKAAFRLDEVLPSEDELARTRESLSGPNAALLQNVAAVIKEDLARVKEALDIYVRVEHRQPADLAALGGVLQQVADTLRMLGLEPARKLAQENASLIADIASGAVEPTESRLFDIARAMLVIESLLDDMILGDRGAGQAEEEPIPGEESGDGEAAEVPVASLSEAEFRQVVTITLHEAAAALGTVKDAILTFIKEPDDYSALAQVSQSCHEILGSLRMLSLDRAAALLESVRRYAEHELVERRVVPTQEQLDSLADAITSIDWYLELTAEQGEGWESILDKAEQSVALLGYPIGQSESAVVGDPAQVKPESPETIPAETHEAATEDTVAAAEVESSSPDYTEPATTVDEPPRGETETALPAPTEGGRELGGSDATSGESEVTELFEAEPSFQAAEPSTEDLATELVLEPLPETASTELSAPVDEPAESMPIELTQGEPEAAEEPDGTALEFTPEPASEGWSDSTAEEVVGETIELASLEPEGADADAAVEFTGITSEEIEIGDVAEIPAIPAESIATGSPEEVPSEPVPSVSGQAAAVPAPPDEPAVDFSAAAEPALSEPAAAIGTEQDIAAADPASSADMPRLAIEPLPADLDADILEVFIEEAEEELAVINEQLPRWQANTEDRDALIRIRRSFHTLKGSGRLVGARLVGEFAWIFENMLNRVIDGTVALAPLHFQLLQQAVTVLPVLIAQLKGGPAPDMDVQRLMDQAQGLAQPGVSTPSVAAIEAPAQAAAATDVGQATALAESTAPVMDPMLYEIYSKEAFSHLEEIEHFVDLCMNGKGDCQVTDGLIRALHTLHGSSHMAGIASVAEVAAVLERYVKAHRAAGAPLSMDGGIALTDGATFIRAVLALLNVPGAVLPDNSALVSRLSELAQQPMAESQAESPETPPKEQAAAPMTPALREARGEDRAAPLAAQGDVSEVLESRQEVPAQHAQSSEDEPDLELLEIFLEEGIEIIESSEIDLQRWIQNQDNPALVIGLQRELHTLKGGARMVGIGAIADLSHALESLLTAVVDGYVLVSKRLFDVLQRSIDRLSGMLDLAREHAPIEPANDLIAELASVRSGQIPEAVEGQAQGQDPQQLAATAERLQLEEAPAPEEEISAGEPEVETVLATDRVEPAEEVEDAGLLQEERRHGSRMLHEMVRVRADILDNLVNYAGEVSIYRSRLEQQIGSLRFNLAELDQTVERLRDQLRRLELETEAQILARHERDTGWQREDFDPLELDQYSQLQQLSRALSESVSDLSSIQGLLDNTTREAATLLLQQARVNTELQEGLMRTRMVPFSGLAGRLRRIVRQSCQELGKQAELHLTGTESELDRTVLDRILAPLEHMLRNAVSHGIETPASRVAAGKPESGRITVALSRDGAEVVIQISDDGAGLNLQAIRRKAIERGLLHENAAIDDQDLLRFILEAGFSTAEAVTQISGRGVGMDVVNNEIKQLGGSLEIYTQPGRGTRFTIRLPFTLAISQALLVQVNEEIYAVPLTSVEGIVRLTHEELERLYAEDAPLYQYADQDYQVRHLGSLLHIGSRHLPGPGRRLPALLVRTGEHRSALVVEGLHGSREIVVKPMGAQLSTVRGISGATILGDGRVVLILDLGTLVRLDAAMPLAVVEEAQPMSVDSRASDITVMVVDDSITVRKVTARLLERHDMKVLTARDGVDALAVLQEHRPDVVLLDIEMPRMDGYELATHIRNEERLRDLPIIMITSRTGEKHRRRALEIGVNRYLGKPYQEAELLEHIREVVANARARELVS